MRGRAALTGLALTLLVLAGCGDDDADPAPEHSSSAAPTPTPSPAEPSVTPASGPVIGDDVLQLNLTDGIDWNVVASDGAVERLDAGHVAVYLGSIEDRNATDLDSYAASQAETYRTDGYRAQRLDNREVAGVEAWVVEARRDGERSLTLGGARSGHAFDITFEVPVDLAEADDMIDSMLASVVWKV